MVANKNAMRCLVFLILTCVLFSPLVSRTVLGARKTPDNLRIIAQDERIEIYGNSDLEEFPGSGTAADPYVISGKIIQSSLPALAISGTTKHVVIRDCIFISDSMGQYTVAITSAENIVIKDCIVRYGAIGISLVDSSNCLIKNTTITHSTRGINLYRSDGNDVIGCTIQGCEYGAYLHSSNGTRIIGNDIFGNAQRGLHLGIDVHYSQVYENTLAWNREAGTLWGSNAADYGSNNIWDDGQGIGNSWSEYSAGPEFTIWGTANATDRFPSVAVDEKPPTITGPDRVDIFEDSEGNYITWNASDRFPKNYRIALDGAWLSYKNWIQKSEVAFLLDNLRAGLYNVTIVVFDHGGNSASHQVTVVINPSALKELDRNLIMMSSLLSLSVVAMVIYAIKRTR